MTDENSFSLTSEAAKELSQLGASKGGDARAQKLSPERRSEIARAAVEARWAKAGKKPPPKATHEGTLRIGDIAIQCAVLEDGSRVISQRGFARAMGASTPTAINRRGAGKLPVLLTAKNLYPFIDDDLEESAKPVIYRPEQGGATGYGIRAEAIPKICDVWLKARDQGVLRHNQVHLAKSADILIRGLAHVGIVALVDEATGYQDDRDKLALAKILEKFIAKELRPYAKRFPTDFYKEMFRLRNWKWPDLPAEQRRRPILVGNLTDNIVYDRLAPGVKRKLKEMIPRDETGRLTKKLFQGLTGDVGDPKLKEHLGAVVALMKAADTWPQFITMIDRALPKHKPLPLFDLPEPKQ